MVFQMIIKYMLVSCTVYIALFFVFLTINTGIGTVFIYFYWYSKNKVITKPSETKHITIY